MIRLSAASIAAASVLAMPAIAQRTMEAETGSRLGVARSARLHMDQALSQIDRSRVVLSEFARCTVDKHTSLLRKTLSAPAGAERSKALNYITDNDCLADGLMSFSSSILRGALFVELWRRRMAPQKAGIRLPELASYDPLVPLSPTASDGEKLDYAMLSFAACVVDRDRQAASDVVTRPVASRDQNEAYRRLAPDLGPCLTEGQKIELSKPVLEGALAEVLYRSPATPPLSPTASPVAGKPN